MRISSKVRKGQHIICEEVRSQISFRYHRITRAVNQAFWNSDSDVDNSFFVGSYGRGTAIETSDLDVLVQLPTYEYKHFSDMSGNGQSRLLQTVKNAILDTYPNTNIKGDGQVVVVSFTDGMKFEILPAFKVRNSFTREITYKYPDTHMGGNWLTTNPKAEQDALRQRNNTTNGLLCDTCKHIRFIRDNYYSSYHLSGILIDSFVFDAVGDWHFPRLGEEIIVSNESYEESLQKYYNKVSLYGLLEPSIIAPGSGLEVDSTNGWDVLGKILNDMV